MISVIIPFRFSAKVSRDQSTRNVIDKIFSYWQLVSELFSLELVFINDNSADFWLQRSFIYPMPGVPKDWNQPAARNYAASIARGEYLLFTDIDHVMYGDFMKLENAFIDGHYFMFPRKNKINDTYVTIGIHKNTFFIRKEDFIGYDEAFCGNYGHDDTEFFFRLKQRIRPLLSEDTLTAFVNEVHGVELSRDTTINKLLLYKKTGKFIH